MRCLQIEDFRKDLRKRIMYHLSRFRYLYPNQLIIGRTSSHYKTRFLRKFAYLQGAIKSISVEDKEYIEWFINRRIEGTGFSYSLWANGTGSYDGIFRKSLQVKITHFSLHLCICCFFSSL